MIIEGVLVFRSVVCYVNQVSWSIISSSLLCAEGDSILFLIFFNSYFTKFNTQYCLMILDN